jgi:hypothetical protein
MKNGNASMALLLLTQAAATWTMVGLIWFVQIVHYPLFRQVGVQPFPDYEIAHSHLTTWVVGPPMLIEGVSAFFLLLYRPAAISATHAWLGVVLLLLIWFSTAFLQVPQHTLLAQGFDPGAHRFLVLSNWLRTVAWTMRGALVLWMLTSVMKNEHTLAGVPTTKNQFS